LLKLYNQTIEKVNEFRYLGYQLNNKGDASNHIAIRRKKAYAALAKMTMASLLENLVDSAMKIHAFNIYIRSVLYYGLDTTFMSKKEINLVKRIDGNLLKKVFGLSKYSRSTSL